MLIQVASRDNLPSLAVARESGCWIISKDKLQKGILSRVRVVSLTTKECFEADIVSIRKATPKDCSGLKGRDRYVIVFSNPTPITPCGSGVVVQRAPVTYP